MFSCWPKKWKELYCIRNKTNKKKKNRYRVTDKPSDMYYIMTVTRNVDILLWKINDSLLTQTQLNIWYFYSYICNITIHLLNIHCLFQLSRYTTRVVIYHFKILSWISTAVLLWQKSKLFQLHLRSLQNQWTSSAKELLWKCCPEVSSFLYIRLN